MELRSVAYNPAQAPGMHCGPGMEGMHQGMPGMQCAPGMEGMHQGMPGMQCAPGMEGMHQGMPGMHCAPGMEGIHHGMPGMQCAPGMYPPGGFVNLDVDADPGCVSYDVGGPMFCSPCDTTVMPPHHRPCPLPTPAPRHKVYVVKKGDTVYKIAKRFCTTMQAIIAENNLCNPDLICPGQVLLIPTVSTGEFCG